MRARILSIGLIQAALLMACGDRPAKEALQSVKDENGRNDIHPSASPVPLGRIGDRPMSQEEVSAKTQASDQWSQLGTYDVISRLIIRTGQASIEVDSLESSMAELRRIVQRSGGVLGDAPLQSGKKQIQTGAPPVEGAAGRLAELNPARDAP